MRILVLAVLAGASALATGRAVLMVAPASVERIILREAGSEVVVQVYACARSVAGEDTDAPLLDDCGEAVVRVPKSDPHIAALAARALAAWKTARGYR